MIVSMIASVAIAGILIMAMLTNQAYVSGKTTKESKKEMGANNGLSYVSLLLRLPAAAGANNGPAAAGAHTKRLAGGTGPGGTGPGGTGGWMGHPWKWWKGHGHWKGWSNGRPGWWWRSQHGHPFWWWQQNNWRGWMPGWGPRPVPR
jgi:hypothetical protein